MTPRESENDMKTIASTKLTALLASVVAMAILAPSPVLAQYHTTGSAKGGATKLMRAYAIEKLQAKSTVASPAMSCENCKDVAVIVHEHKFKGASKPNVLGSTKTVYQHQCPNCRNEWKVTGHGKNKVRVAKHLCASCL